MNKFLFYILLLTTMLSINYHQTNALPLKGLDLKKTVKNVQKVLLKIGKATYYDVEAGTGSCGLNSKHSDKVVAISRAQMGSYPNPNENPKCGKKVNIVGPDGDSYEAEVVDTCPGCESNCLDMSSSLFEQVCGKLELGVCKISWDFI